jgi:hypothetical protein
MTTWDIWLALGILWLVALGESVLHKMGPTTK